MSLAVTSLEEPAKIRTDKDDMLPEQSHLKAPTHFIIFDEITMLTGPGLDCCVAELERIGFTGVLLISGNDAQLPPVLVNAPPETVIANHIVSSRTYLSPRTTHVTLRKNVRLEGDKQFAALCLAIGYGMMDRCRDGTDDDSEIHDAPSGERKIMLPTELVNPIAAKPENMQNAWSRVFPSLFPSQGEPYMPEKPDSGSRACIACPTHDLRTEHNAALSERLPGKFFSYTGVDEVLPLTGTNASDEELRVNHAALADLVAITVGMDAKANVPDLTILLKKGCCVASCPLPCLSADLHSKRD